jgi:hypothetical protein
MVKFVEKINLARIRKVQGKCNLLGCSAYDDLILGKGQTESKKSFPLVIARGFFYRLVAFVKNLLTKDA